MTGLWVIDGTGTYQKANAGMWLADATGTWRPAQNGWIADANGQYQKFWPYSVAVSSFTAVKGSPSYDKVTLAWSAVNCSKIELYLAGASQPFFTSTATSGATAVAGGSTSYTGVPGTRYSYMCRAYAADGSSVDSQPATLTLDALPAPTGFKRTGGTSTGIFWGWTAVPDATSYEVVDTLSSNAVKGSINAPTVAFAETGLHASSTYERAVRSKLSSATSALSNKVRYTTAANPGTAPGTYNFPATYAEAWSPGYQNWRGSGVGIVHGNGDNWGGANGNNVTMFFYNVAALRALSGRVTRFKIELHRDSTAGYSSAQSCHFIQHTAATRPAGNPGGYLGFGVDSGSLAWGDGAAIDLPVAVGQNLIDSTANISGIAWGYVGGRYMRGPSLAAQPAQGKLYITIG